MKSKHFRVQKSEWFLSSFYFITFFILLMYGFIFGRMLFLSFSSLFSSEVIISFLKIVGFNMGLVLTSLLISIPMAALMTIFLVLSEGHVFGRVSQKLLKFFVKLPMLISGLAIIFWFREASSLNLVHAILIYIIVPRLALRWFNVANQLEQKEIESALSIGMGFWDVLYVIYIKKYGLPMLKQTLVMSASVIGLMTPYLYFISDPVLNKKLGGFVIFQNLLKNQQQNLVVPTVVGFFIVISLSTLFLDKNDEQYGEWNG